MNHVHFIHHCLSLASKGRGKVGINPMVGSVLVRDDKIIAQAYHEGFGLPHAERVLLENFKDKIESDDVLYINLEPCCHHGKTSPCTSIIIEKGIKHVVYGMKDPNSKVFGKGIEAFRKAGIEVIGPVLPELCGRLNRGFVSLQTKGRPYITLKRAQTRAGKIAKIDGSPLKITSAEQDKWSHEYLRARHDAILVGVGTVISDDPQLTVRLKNKKLEQISALRIVLDPNSITPKNAQIRGDGTLIVTQDEVLLKDGIFEWNSLWKVLVDSGISSMLVEGGAQTWDNFKKAGMIDEEVWLIGDK